MKRNNSGDFCVLFVEGHDQLVPLLEAIRGQEKPVILLLAEQTRLFQRPEDFNALKHAKRQLDQAVMFVIPGSEHQRGLAQRHGFSVYASMDELAEAVALGQATRQRVLNRNSVPPHGEYVSRPTMNSRRTLPLLEDNEATYRRTGPLPVQPQHTGPLPMQPRRPELYTPAPQSTIQLQPQPHQLQPHQHPQPSRRLLPGALLVLLAIALTFAGVGSFLLFFNQPTNNLAAAPLVGKVAFTSSEQLSENNSQGIMDQVTAEFSSLTPPAAGKGYYAWLLADKKLSETKALFLGKLNAADGKIRIFYQGDGMHTNLLLTYSRFLITEEDSTVTPQAPSPDQKVWRYYGEFAQVASPGAENAAPSTYLDHLRHLLAADPTLDKLELPGGLNNWQFRNTGKVLEWTGSMREAWEGSKDVGLVRRQTIRTLAYLDGLSFARQDVPEGTSLLVTDRLARVGLICVNGPNQDPACYVSHVVHHMNGLLQIMNPTPEQRQNIASMVSALNNVTYWLTQVRQNAQQIMKLSDEQLKQPETLALINNMIVNANYAYTGQDDPASGEKRQGVVWLHHQMQSLATIDVRPFTGSANPSSWQMAPNFKQASVFMSLVQSRREDL
jgi:hypothetical protein